MVVLALAVLISTGAIDPKCTKEMVCQDGYTATVRPKVVYTNGLKEKQLKTIDPSILSKYEEDHFIPLELCGCPTCSDNLWPQLWPEARRKDVDETRLRREVCAGQKTLEAAQEEIRGKWKIHE